MEGLSDAEVLGRLRATRGVMRVAARQRPGRRNRWLSRQVAGLKAECRRRGLMAESRRAKPRFPRAGG